jgi:hypothetical protein
VLAATGQVKTRKDEERAVMYGETVVDLVNRHEDLKWLLTILIVPKHDKQCHTFISIIISP